MSKPATAPPNKATSNSAAPSPVSAWSKGPPIPNNNSNPAAPRANGTPIQSHSRKPSAVSANAPPVSLKEGLVVPSARPVNVPSSKPQINFGSIDDGNASVSSSPANTPQLSRDAGNVKSFGSIANTPASSTAPSSKHVPSTTTPTGTTSSSSNARRRKLDVNQLFQGTPTSSEPSPPPTSSSSSAAAPPPVTVASSAAPPVTAAMSPPQRMQSLPPQVQPPHTFYPQHLRNAPVPGGVPRSPQLSRGIPTINGNGAPVPGRQHSNQVPSSPRPGQAQPQLQSQQQQQQQQQQQSQSQHQQGPGGSQPQGPMNQPQQMPVHMQPWPPAQYYYATAYGYPEYRPQYDTNSPSPYPEQQYLPQPWSYAPPPQHHLPPPAPHHNPHHAPPHSPRIPSVPPQPSTPIATSSTLPPNVPVPVAPSTTSSPQPNHSTPRSTSSPLSAHPPSSLSLNAPSFVPGNRRSVKISKPDGELVDLSKIASPVAPHREDLFTPPNIASLKEKDDKRDAHRRTQSVIVETEEMNRTRKLQKEEAEKEAARKEKEKEEALEKERLKKEEEQRAKKEEEERLKKEEEERIAKEKAEAEAKVVREREEAEAKAQKEKEEAEAKARMEKEAAEEVERQRLKEEEEARARREAEEREAQVAREAAEEAKKKAAEEEERAKALAAEKEQAEEALEKKEILASSSPSPAPSSTLPPNTLPSKPVNGIANSQRSHRPVPPSLDFSTMPPKPSSFAQPPLSALASARIIEDLEAITYPEGVSSPVKELNINAEKGKFRYDRSFLLQFMEICKDKPDNLPPLDAIGIAQDDNSGPGMGRAQNRRSVSSMPPPGARTPSGVGLGITGAQGASIFNRPGSGIQQMGQFQPPTARNSVDRFAAANAARSTSVSGGPFGPGVGGIGRPAQVIRSASQGGVGGLPQSPKDPHQTNRTRSQRGNKRGEKPPSQASSVSHFNSPSFTNATLEMVAPLEQSGNRWVPVSTSRHAATALDETAVIERKVKALLNKLTMENFDSISNQIIEWANKSEKEKDGKTLIQVIKLVFEKATDEAPWSEMYARLCRKMMEQISPDVQDESIKNSEGNPIAGGQLFRKYLLNRCQEDFEKGWSARQAAAVLVADEGRAADDKAKKDAAEGKTPEVILYSDEYYLAQKAKRQGLGLVKFIGELFKLQMLTERIMHECIKKLLSNVDDPEEEEIESLCKLLSTVGQALDTNKARSHMDVYFARMADLAQNPRINSRMQYMLQDVIEFRLRHWVPRNQTSAPTTIARVHEAAAKEAEKEAHAKTAGRDAMVRGGSRRGDHRRDEAPQGNAEGWNVAGGGGGAPRAPPKAGDLSHFGKISKVATSTFGPTSIFNKKDAKGRETPTTSLSRTASSSNMFSMLSSNSIDGVNAEPSTVIRNNSRPPSRKNSVDFSQGGGPEALGGRKKLNLLPRTVPVGTDKVEEEDTAHTESDGESPATEPSMSEDEAKVKINEDIKELWNVRNLDDAESYFVSLPKDHHHLLVHELVAKTIESKDEDVSLVSQVFSAVSESNICSASSFEKGFAPSLEFLDDLAIDSPSAYTFVARLLRSTNLPQEAVESLASKINVDGDPVVSPRDRLIQEYDKFA